MRDSSDALDLLVIGDLNPDLILTGNVAPRFGQVEQIVDRAELVVGGSGALVACGAARLGLSAALVAVVGADDLGSMMRGRVKGEGVDVGSVRVADHVPSGMSVILVDAGDRAILTAKGAIGDLGPADLAAAHERPARHVHVASPFLMTGPTRTALARAIERFRETGATTSLDPNWDPAEAWDLGGMLDVVDLVFPNARELVALAGANGVDEAMERWPHRATPVVKLGAEGGAMRRPDGSISRVAASAEHRVVDTIGAGDSFDAGFIAGSVMGRPAMDALALAVAAGIASTTGAGGTAAQPSIDEADRIAASLPRSGSPTDRDR